MAGHSKWANIKHKKGAADAKRGKTFTRLSKEVIMAAKMGGSDPDANARLRTAINAAKAANMPNDNIERAVKKGAGELEGQVMEELSYECYGAGGIALIISCLSDNRNRTAADIRHIITRNNSVLANSGTVNWMFHRKARFLIEGEAANEETLMELLLDNDVDIDDIIMDENTAEILAEPNSFDGIVAVLEAAGITPSESSIAMVPENRTQVEDAKTATQLFRLIDALEENDDVQEVSSNLDISDELMAQLAEEE
ncbi:MAG: YebC/PmpR family DNA-binding transcriptional regulator [Lentisphaeria bacterium]|nr:YebC/PmpR family DNA-binding transcriptional regulator [Lentisphaeria bacterium]NQZ69749.1 YebC/PmpR family DNA-binding transcriptional regulator [Lentisphaeria bacterium]